MSRTNIFETLVDMRNAAAKELWLALNPGHEDAPEETLSDEFGPAPSSKSRKSPIVFDEEQVLTILAPSVSGVDGIAVKVLYSSVKSALYAEATTENLSYFRAVCAAQIADGGVKRFGKRKRDACSTSLSGTDNSQSMTENSQSAD